MDLDQLRGFYYAAKLKSFTEAAARLYLSQPAISLQVKALESRLGEKLFERCGRGVRLTHAGEVLYAQAEGLVEKLREIEQVMEDLKCLERGRLRLGASDTTSMYFLPGLLRAYRDAHPGVEVSIESLFSEAVCKRVLARELDLGIVTLPHTEPRLATVPLFSQRLVGLVPEGHPLCRRRVLSLSHVAREPLILLGKESLTRRLIEGWTRQRSERLQVVLELSNFEIIKRYVAAGLGVSVVPEGAVAGPVPGARAIPFRRVLSITAGTVYVRDRSLPRAARAFLDMARGHFAAAPRPVADPPVAPCPVPPLEVAPPGTSGGAGPGAN